MTAHTYYNRANFPRLVWARPDSNWHIYANESGKCASIPVRPGCEATQFGDLAHVRDCKHRQAAIHRPELLAVTKSRAYLLRWLMR